ncbi:TonB-dependent receptor [Acinetobacter sp. ME22]|uniref:TonB-dependent receptor plug domain-containing protein n=1 Tax=Acinetobacter sp. ME22 TaxID=2904802 RepID=UPI001ED9FAA2|nr:TonB-dependent receptor [Acinetobacter sp. ME22]MCG2572177.1 TonB-dependent receptor [Acinetobacter sp. ME22]
MKLYPQLLAFTVVSLMASQVFAEDTAQTEEDNVTQLPSIVVSASLKEESVDKAPASVSVVTKEEIARSAATNVAEVLSRQVGVVNYNTGQDKITIRGMRDTSGSYTLILLNGKRMSSLGALWRGNDFDWSAIPLNSIERIEVIRGPMSSLYGSDAMGGVINIITKKAEAGKLTGTAYAQYNRLENGDGRNQFSYGTSVQGGLTDQLSFSLSAAVTDKDAWYRNTKDTSASNYEGAYFVEKQSQNVMGTLTWDVSDQQSVDFDVGYNHDKRPLTYDSATTYASQEINRTNLGLTHRGKWGWGSTEAYIGYERSDIDDNDSEYDTPQQRSYKQENLLARAFANFDWWINSTTAGVDFKNQKITDKVSYSSGGNEQKSYGIFTQNDTKLRDDLTLTLGARYDDFDNFEGKATAKAYLTYEFSPGVVLKGGFGQAYKAPSPYQLDSNYKMISCGGSCYIYGNSDLKPEESTNYEASLVVTRPNWNVSATVFENDVKNLIERTTNTGANSATVPYRWGNTARAEFRGVELTAGYRFNDRLGIKTNATYLESTNKATGKDLTERPEWTANAALDWTIVEQFKATVAANYIGKQWYNSANTISLPSYTTYDLTFSTPVSKKLTVDYGVRNLTDVNLEDKTTYFATKLYGRNYFVKLSYNF